MNERTRELVRARAQNRCEYCHLPQENEPFFRFHVEHIRARQHGGNDDDSNLALACHHCNLYKGPNLTGIDAQTGQVVLLFDPRSQNWTEHFEMQLGVIVARSNVGSATVSLLRMNEPARVKLRQLW